MLSDLRHQLDVRGCVTAVTCSPSHGMRIYEETEELGLQNKEKNVSNLKSF